MENNKNELRTSTQILYAKESTVYVIPGQLTKISIGKKKVEKLLQTAVDEGFSYRIYQRNDLPAELAAKCSKLGNTVIFAYFLPDVGEYVYSVMKLSEIDDAFLKTILRNIKSSTFESRRNALINLAYNNPELLEKVISSGIELCEHSQDESYGCYPNRCYPSTKPSNSTFAEPVFRGTRSVKGDETSLKEMATLMKRFLRNVRKYKEEGDPIAKKEIDIILNNSVGVSDKLWETVFSSLLSNKSQKEFFNVCIDRYTLGKRSTMKIKVKQEDDDKLMQNHGKYYPPKLNRSSILLWFPSL